MCMVGRVQKQFGHPATKYVGVREVKGVDGSKIERLFSFSRLFPGLGGWSVVPFITLLTDTPPGGTGIVEMFENTKVPSNPCPNKFNPAINQRQETLRVENRPYTRSISWSCFIR